MHIAARIKIQVTPDQADVLWRLSERCRLLYKFALAERNQNYQEKKGRPDKQYSPLCWCEKALPGMESIRSPRVSLKPEKNPLTFHRIPCVTTIAHIGYPSHRFRSLIHSAHPDVSFAGGVEVQGKKVGK